MIVLPVTDIDEEIVTAIDVPASVQGYFARLQRGMREAYREYDGRTSEFIPRKSRIVETVALD